MFVDARLIGGRTHINTSTKNSREIIEFLACKGIPSYRKRLPIYKYRFRYGVILGILIFVFLITYLSSFLWAIDVTGNSRLTEQEIKTILRDCGVYEGVKLKDINNDLVRIKAMSRSKDIAWISVNVRGIRAEVVVAESQRAPEKEEEAQCANIVAGYDGLITGIVIERGTQMVKVGETVKKGDLLVSGIIEERDGDVTFVNASAKVYAQTERAITVEQPYKIEKVTQTDGKLQRFSLECFGKKINFSFKYGLSKEKCDIISKRGSIYIFRDFRLPVSYTAEYQSSRVVGTVSLTREQAIAAAQTEAYRLLFSQANAELVSRRFSYNFDEDKLTAYLYAVCEENIAKNLPFTAE
jgi:similar to stage IV sporulation protein